jgi:hypothetical protein
MENTMREGYKELYRIHALDNFGNPSEDLLASL